MTEFTKDDIEHYRKQYALWTSRGTTPEELHLISRLRDTLDEIERQRERIAEWRQDAERLAKDHQPDTDGYCKHCQSCRVNVDDGWNVIHTPDCPITLHRELVAKYGNNEEAEK